MGIKSALNNKILESSIIAISLGITIACIYTPDVMIFKKISHYTVHIMLFFLTAGFFFLLYDQKKLLIWHFILVGVLSIFLKSSSNAHLQLAKDSGLPVVKVAFINLSNITLSPSSITNHLINNDVEIIALNELTPNWISFLDSTLSPTYPYQNILLRVDNYGKAIYSKIPISQSDTLIHEGIPHLFSHIKLGSNIELGILNTYFLPPLTRIQLSKSNKQLDFLITKIIAEDKPLICLGDFNLAPWSNELRAFKYATQLNDSRRDIIKRSNQGIGSMLNVPVEHITFNKKLSCILFENLHDEQNNYIGLIGKYQLTSLATPNISIQ